MTCGRIYTLSNISGETGVLHTIHSDNIYNSNLLQSSSIYSSYGSVTSLSSSKLGSSNVTVNDNIKFTKGRRTYTPHYVYPEITSDSSFFYSGHEPYISGNPSEYIGEFIKLNEEGSILAASSTSGNGLVRVFLSDEGNWGQLGSDIQGSPSHGFGSSIDLNGEGDILAVGAPSANLNSGIVNVYDWDGSSWNQRSPSISGKSIEDFGCSLALSNDGDYIAIGAASANSNSGVSRVYNWSNGSWIEMSDGVSGTSDGETLGSSIDITNDGQTIFVGGSGDSLGDGLVKSYKYSGSASSGILGGFIFTSNQDSSTYNNLSISVLQIAGGTIAPNPPTPATALYDGGLNALTIFADINNGQATNSGVYIDLSSAPNSAHLSSAGFFLSLLGGLELDPVISSGPTLTEGGLDPFWNQKGQTISGSNNEKLGSSIQQGGSSLFAAGGLDGNNGDGSIYLFQMRHDKWGFDQNSFSGSSFNLNGSFDILSVGYPEANLGSGLCRTYGYHTPNWETIGPDLNGSSLGEKFGKSVAINKDGSLFFGSANFFSTDKGLVRQYDFDYISDLELNSTRVKSENLNLDYYKLPTFDPLVIGDVWRDQGGFLKISAGWTPAVLNTLAWYDAADAFTITSNSNIISQIDDKSGNGYHLNVLTANRTGPKTGVQTLNGLNVFTWDTIGQVLENNSFSYDQNSNGLYFAIIFKCIVDNVKDFILAGTNLDTSGNRMAIRRSGNFNSLQIIGGSGTGSDIVLGTSPGSVLEGEDFLIVSKFNGSNSHIRINGEFTKSGNIGTNAFSSLNIGANEIANNAIKGYIAEIIFFTNPEDESSIEGYLAHKWGLSAKLPDSHTYKTKLPL